VEFCSIIQHGKKAAKMDKELKGGYPKLNLLKLRRLGIRSGRSNKLML
jgi:hypothetical protein